MATRAYGVLLFLRLIAVEFPGDEPVPCPEESPARPACRGNLAGKKEMPPETPCCANSAPRETFVFLPHKEAVPTVTALRSCPSLAEAAGWWTYSCRTPAPRFSSPRANPKYRPKYHARLALAHPGMLYSSGSTSDALRIIMSVKLSKHFTAEWTHPGNLSRIRRLPVDEYFSKNNHSVSNLQPCSLGKTHKIPSKNEHER